MNPRKAVKELEKQLRKDPENLVLRVRLAGALVQVGGLLDAVEMYRSVALAYFGQNRVDQAIAVCHSVLEIAPDHHPTRVLLSELDQRKAQMVQAPPTVEAERVDSSQMSSLGDRRRNKRPSGFESGAFTPASEPDLQHSARLRFESDRVERVDPPPSGKRLPLPLSPPGGSGERGKRPSEAAEPPRPARPSQEAGGRRQGANAPDPDEEAPTRIADRWISHTRNRQPAQLPPRGKPASTTPQGSKSSSWRREPTTEKYEPTSPTDVSAPSTASPVTDRTRPQRKSAMSRPPDLDENVTSRRTLVPLPTPSPAPAYLRDESSVRTRMPRRRPSDGEVDEATMLDDGIELARALGRPFGQDGGGSGVVEDSHRTLALLAGLPEPAVQEIARGMARHRVQSGDMILREGETGDSCFVLAHGEARVLKRDPLQPRGDLIEVSRLGQGDIFGEVAMLSDRRRHASVQAVGDCELMEIPRQHLRMVATRYPEVTQFLERFYRERIVATLVSTAAFFRPLDKDARMALLAHFQFTRVEAGARIIKEGERSGGFYLIVLGTVEITKRVSERRQVLLATLDEGNYFGEMSLLRGDVARASVTATGATELAVLPAKNFYALVANHPILWDQVRQEAHRRELEIVQIVTGMTGSV